MSYPVYYVEAGDTLPILFDTFSGSTGASITMTGLAVTDIEIYKDGSVTQRASDAGFTLLDTDGTDFDGLTGIHGFSIDLSDNTDAGFYAVGSWYHVVVSSVTIDTQTVSFIAAAFRIVSATRGMAGTALPDAAADAAGGLPISDTGGLDLDAKIGALTFTVAGDVDVNVQSWAGTAVATPDTAGYPVITIKDGTGQGEIALTSGAIDSVAAVSGAVGSVTGSVGSIASGGITSGSFGAGAIDAAAIGTGAVDADALAADAVNEIWAKTIAEPTGAFAWSDTVLDIVEWLGILSRNKITQTSTTTTVRNDADGADVSTSTVSDNGTTFTRTEFT